MSEKIQVLEGVLWYNGRLCVPADSELKQVILQEAHDTLYSIHPGGTKMYQDLKEQFWWHRPLASRRQKGKKSDATNVPEDHTSASKS